MNNDYNEITNIQHDKFLVISCIINQEKWKSDSLSQATVCTIYTQCDTHRVMIMLKTIRKQFEALTF